MAPHLAQSQRDQIHDMIRASSLCDRDIANIVGCSQRTVVRVRANVRAFGAPSAPKAAVGRPSRIPRHVLDALLDHLLTKPDLYIDEMAEFILDEFEINASEHSVRRSLKACDWSKKKTQRVACERDRDLRDACLYELSEYKSYQLVFVDESGCDTLAGVRRTGWAPRGMPAVQIARFHREDRHQILPAYTQSGVMHTRIFQGSTDGEFFEDFIKELLPMCGRWPEPNSVLVMDNASFHQGSSIKGLCEEAGVMLFFLSPYSPDLNPIEEFFSQLKAFIRRRWRKQAHNFDNFGDFLRWAVGLVGSDVKSAQGHFRNSGLTIDRLH
jgi:transposase